MSWHNWGVSAWEKNNMIYKHELISNIEEVFIVTSGPGVPRIDCVISSVQICCLDITSGLPQVWHSSEGTK